VIAAVTAGTAARRNATRRRGKQNPVWHEGLDTGLDTGRCLLSLQLLGDAQREDRRLEWEGWGSESVVVTTYNEKHRDFSFQLPVVPVEYSSRCRSNRPREDYKGIAAWRYVTATVVNSCAATIRRLGRSWLWILGIKISSSVFLSAWKSRNFRISTIPATQPD